ncbi:MAG: ATP-binding cassette domain-containing protein [Candidatus Tectimicrobiota bacterium]
MTPLLDVQGVQKHFPRGTPLGRLEGWFSKGMRRTRDETTPQVVRAVDDVSFALEAGECLGLVGESGSGKSTLVRVITRLLDPTAGVIRFAGRDIASVPASRFARDPARAALQLVFQDPTDSLNPRYSAFASIAEPLRRLGHIRGRTALRSRVEALADLVGLPGALLERLPHQLSGGQKARVGIARAVALQPSLLILDEPTSALDVSMQAVILHLLANLRQRLGMSYVFISHDLNVIRLLCDRVLVMYRGKIIESGPSEAVLNRPEHAYTRALVAALPTLAGEDC